MIGEAGKKPLKLVEVDENYIAPADASTEDKAKATKAAAIREGIRRQKERSAEAFKVIGTAHAAELTRLTKERDARVTPQEESKHGRAKYWQGFALGAVLAGAIVATGAAFYTKAVIDPAFDAAARMQMQQDVVNTLERGANQ